MNRLAHFAPFLLCGVLTACGASRTHTYSLPTASAAPSSTVQLVDRRPPEEKVFRGSSSDPVWRYGDDEFSPGRVSVLKAKIEREVAGRSPGAVVSLERFEIANNHKAFEDKSQKVKWLSILGGPLGGVAAASLIGEEESGNHIFCVLYGSANGARFEARYSQPYTMSGSWTTTALNDPVVNKTVSEVVDRCTDLAAREIAEKLGSAAGSSVRTR